MLSEDGASNVRWLRLDCSTLKKQLVALCDNWVGAFSGLLAALAARQLAGLEEELQSHVAQLSGNAPVGQPSGGDAAEAEQGKQTVGMEEEGQAEGQAESDPVAVLEALYGRLEGEREELAQRLAACQEKYEALVSLQVGWVIGGHACHATATVGQCSG